MVVYIHEGDGDNDGDDDEDGGHLANIALVHEPAHCVLLVSTLKGNLDTRNNYKKIDTISSPQSTARIKIWC